MSLNFVPDYRFEKFDMVTADFLAQRGIKGVILDIDNTLEPYENPIPGERVLTWLRSLDDRGIKYPIVSNNNKERVEEFNKNSDILLQKISALKGTKETVLDKSSILTCNSILKVFKAKYEHYTDKNENLFEM